MAKQAISGPTHNRAYNRALASWATADSPAQPECEDCGADMTGAPVFETEVGWLCTACAEREGFDAECDCRDCADAHHEARCDSIAAGRYEAAAYGRDDD